MAFDATLGGTGANSYATVATVSTYLTDAGNVSAWASAETADKETALVRATRMLESRYTGKWPGSIADYTQALSWPRANARDREGRPIAIDAIPPQVVAAVSELALIALTDSNLFTDAAAAAGGVKRLKIKVGPIEKETEYAGALSVSDVHRRVSHLLNTLVGRGNRLRRV